MGLSDSRLAYKDCYDILEKAMADPKGIKIKFKRLNAAEHLRARIHQARKIDRKENMRVFKEDDPMYGLSEFDNIVTRIGRDGSDTFWLNLIRRDRQIYGIESLADGDEDGQQQTANSDSREADRAGEVGEVAVAKVPLPSIAQATVVRVRR